MKNFNNAILNLVDFDSKDFLLAFGRCLDGGRKRVRIVGNSRNLQPIPGLILSRFGANVELIRSDAPGSAASEEVDMTLLLESDPARLAALLHQFIDRPAVLFAPRTERYFCGGGLFVVTIPKSGTHLLFHLLNEFRLHSGGALQNSPVPHTWYFPHGNDSHVPASRFFHEIGQVDRGGFEHPLFTTPVIFMYRNPLDILVSEATYLGAGGKAPASHYFQALDEATRISELIENPLLVGWFHERMMSFSPWLSLPNVIPVSFEELVGPKGGGSLDAQVRAIWSLQLRLQIPGVPAFFAEVAFFTGSPTFNKGQIGRHKQVLKPRHMDALAGFPQQFMQRFGYDIADECGPGYLPRFVDGFRNQELVFPGAAPSIVVQPAAESSAEDHATDMRVFSCHGYLIALCYKIWHYVKVFQ